MGLASIKERVAKISRLATERNAKVAGWIVTAFIAGFSASVAYDNYVLAKSSSDPMTQTCGAVVDVRSSFLEVGAEATTRTEPGRSRARDQLDRDVTKLTENANRTNNSAIRVAATNVRVAIAKGLNLTPMEEGDAIWEMKMCLLNRFFSESEVIAAKCRQSNLPATPEPRSGASSCPLKSVCDDLFSSAM